MAAPEYQTHKLEVGLTFEEKYRIVREIGRGGFGMVYLAHQQAMDRQVALKVLKAGLGEHQAEKAKERFLREVRVISSLRHPNTVTIHDFGETEAGLLYMVLEYIEGEGLDDILDREGAQSPDRALHFGMQVARSLAEAHRHGVVHRDLKPANIMVTRLETEGDFVKVLDFGVARLLKTEQEDLTQMGMPDDQQEVLGTPRYMSPEQVRGHEIDGRSDVYCLGLLLYEMLVGEPAVQGDTSMSLITQHISPEPLQLEGLRGLPGRIGQIVRRCTHKDIDGRYESAEALVRDLRQVSSTLAKGAGAGAGGSASSGSMPAASMSFEGQSDPFVTDYEDQLADMNNSTGGGVEDSWDPQPQTPSGTAQPSLQSPSGPAPGSSDQQRSMDFGDANPFGETRPRERNNVSFGDLPPPTEDDDAFAAEPEPSEPDSARSANSAHDDAAQKRDQEVASSFAFDTLKITFFALIAVFGVYTAFILIGTMFGEFLGGQMRIFATLILCLAIPVLTALGETSDRERFRVVQRRINRVTRALIATAILSCASGALVSLAMPNTVVAGLRSNPNWFLSGQMSASSLGEANRKISGTYANLVAVSTGALGLYNPVPGDNKKAPAKPTSPTGPPAPTRPSSTKPAGNDGPDEESSDQRRGRSAIELLKNPPDSDESNDEGSQGSSGSTNSQDRNSGSYEEW